MKISKQMKTYGIRTDTSGTRLLILDEYHLAAGDSLALSAKRIPSMIVTQAFVTRNSGKKVRFISFTKWANGDPIKPAPKKFLPAQVLRRQEISKKEKSEDINHGQNKNAPGL